MVDSEKKSKRKKIIFTIAMLSILLYFLGVLSGLYATELIEKRTASDIGSLKNETAKNIEELKNYISFMESNLKSAQFSQIFAESLNKEEMCTFYRISINNSVYELQYYRDRLPFRIEEYEKNNNLSQSYIDLKERYNKLSVLIWIMTRNAQNKCHLSLVNGLYFYSRNCTNCVEQGEQLDIVTEKLIEQGKEVTLFTIDFDSNDPLIKSIKQTYNITSIPAIILNDKVYKGRLFTAGELLEGIEE